MKWWVILVCLTLPSIARSNDIKEGLWQISLMMRADDQDFGPFTQEYCFTSSEIQNPSKLFAQAMNNCEFTNRRLFGNEFRFNIHCNVGIPFMGLGVVEYSPDSLHGSMELQAGGNGSPSVETRSEILGKRLGSCPK